MSSKLLVFFIIIISLNNLYAQKRSSYETSYSEISKQIEKKLVKKAIKRMPCKEYDKAIKNYSELLTVDPENSNNNYAMAITLYSNFQQPKSIPYFERALRYSKDTIIEAYFFLAKSYHLARSYDKAEQNYRIYNSLLESNNGFLPKEDIKNSKIDISHRIEMCENGKFLSSGLRPKSPILKEGKNIRISDIGSNINTTFNDFGAVFSADDSTLYFTSRKADDGNIYFSHVYNSSHQPEIKKNKVSSKNTKNAPSPQNVFLITDSPFIPQGKKQISELSPKWTPVENIGWPINTRRYEAVINISPDGKRIYFYRSGNQQGKAVYYSDFLDNHWGFPELLLNSPELINTFQETNIYCFALTAAKDELFVISDRDGGVGGKDIYVSKKMSDSTWGALENLGEPINTQNDEVALSLSPDGNTMYFSSNGNKSIGGFDVFVSCKKDGHWLQPINLGIPINTPGDDLFFSFLHDSDRATYSSSAHAADNSTDLDIYFIDFYPVDTLATTITTLVFDTVTGKVLSEISFNNSLFDDKSKIKEIYERELDKTAPPLKESGGRAVTTFSFNNTLFDFDKSKIKETYKGELDKAVEFLNQVKPDSRIVIAGYADSKGHRKHNLILSKQRADAVAKYLISKKINKTRIKTVGYGETKPIAPNNNPDGTDNPTGRAKNRRTEIVIK